MKILRLLTRTKGITIKDLSKQSGVTQSTLHNLLSGRSAGHREKLGRIAHVLGVPVAFLFVTDEMTDAIEKGIYRNLKIVITQILRKEVEQNP